MSLYLQKLTLLPFKSHTTSILNPRLTLVKAESISNLCRKMSTWSCNLKRPCKTCTYSNPYKNTDCEICGARALLSSLSILEDLTDTGLEDDPESAVGSVFFPLRRCSKRRTSEPIADDDSNESECVEMEKVPETKGLGKKQLVKETSKKLCTVAGTKVSGATSTSLKILTYNVWFREDLEMHMRMKAIGDLVLLHSPDLICFQEVTPDIYNIFCRSNWWKSYRCSVSSEKADSSGYFCMQLSKLPVESFDCKPFRNSIMRRELCTAQIKIQGSYPLVVATTHLESPCPGPPKWDQMFSKERVQQATEALNILKENPNVVFCGDMNWDNKLDGRFPFPDDNWIDVWEQLKPSEDGFTYDTKSNLMLSGNRTLQKRLDRFLCCLRDFRVISIEMIGKEAIPGLSYCKEKRTRDGVKYLELPVLPSDHYGLLLTISTMTQA